MKPKNKSELDRAGEKAFKDIIKKQDEVVDDFVQTFKKNTPK